MNTETPHTVELTEHQLDKILKTLNEIKLEREVFFKGIIDFLKWTTTFSLASIIWVATNFYNPMTLKTFLQISLILLIFSTIISIITVYSIIIHWGKNWEIQELLFKVYRSAFKMEKEKQDLEEDKISLWMLSHLPHNPGQFNSTIVLHLSLLLAGLIFYALSLILT